MEKAPLEQQIQALDVQMARLFEQRAAFIQQLGQELKDKALPWEHLLTPAAPVALDTDPVTADAYRLFHGRLEEVDRLMLRRVASGLRVAYAGVSGAFAELAAKKIYPSGNLLGYADFDSAYHAVESGEADCAVLPIENSYAGDVAQVMDLAYFGNLSISGVYDFPIEHHLLGLPGTLLGEVKTVISHPQALGQCGEYLRKRGFATKEAPNTAIAASRVKEGGDPTVCAIGSEQAAESWGLAILDRHINESSFNTTRFAVFTPAPHGTEGEDSRFILTFTVRNEAGALGHAIDAIGAHGFNMRVLRSRPTKKLMWSNFFYVEGEGSLTSERGKQMLKELENCCSGLKVLGTFSSQTLS